MRWRGMTFERSRVLPVVALDLLVVLGFVLPYVTLSYVNLASQTVTATERIGGAAALLGGMDPTYLTNADAVDRSAMNLAFNLMAAGPGVQQVAAVVLLLSSWCLLSDEINKFVWWPLHLAGYPLVLAAVPLLVGVVQATSADVPVVLGPAFVPLVLAGGLALVVSRRSRGRIDTYSSI